MTTLVQLSDLHFGSNDIAITAELQKTVRELNPEVVVVSGDLTTRARTVEFIQAKQFLKYLPGEHIVVPGNHDISLYDVFRRFFKPLDRFKKIISQEVESHYINKEVMIIGLNSSRSFTVKGGNISAKQLEKVEGVLSDVPSSVMRIVVTHHPLNEVGSRIVDRLMELGINFFVSGHMHKSASRMEKHQINGRQLEAVFVEAGTATSVRYRSEPNSFNFLTIDGSSVVVRTHTWQSSEAKFVVVNERQYRLNR